ncbi:MAG: nitrite reductase small subunit NirD [Sulfuricella sp.]|nr:nitrite reductase small subunit NirD [Sulfuricella sp.]
MTEWIKICALEEIPRQGTRKVKSGDAQIALFRTQEDEIFALADRCPHKGGPLSEGMVCGKHVTCALHSWNIGLADGKAVAPDVGETPTYPVKVDGGVVFVQL